MLHNATQYFTSQEHYKQFRSAWSSAVNSPNAKKQYEPCDQWRYDIKKGSIIEGWEPVGNGWSHVSKNTGLMVVKGWIKAEHHLLFNLLTGRPLHTGFSPIVNKKKLNPYISNMHNFYDIVWMLQKRAESAQALLKDRKAVEKLRGENSFINVIDKLRGYLKDSGEEELLKENTGFTNLVTKLRTHLTKRPKDLLHDSTKKRHESQLKLFLRPFDGTVTLEMLAMLDVEQLRMITMFDVKYKQNYWLHAA